MEALRDGDSRENFIGWIDRFCGQIVESRSSFELDVVDLNARLSGLRDVSTWALWLC